MRGPKNTTKHPKNRQKPPGNEHLLLGLREGLDEGRRVLLLLGTDERVGRSLSSRPSRPPDAVHVVLQVVRARVVDDAHQVGNVQTSAASTDRETRTRGKTR